MDVRLSPEQQAPARLRRPGRRPARPARRRPARRRRARRQARRRRRRPSGWRELRTPPTTAAPLGLGGRGRDRRRGARPRPRRRRVPRPDPRRRAPPPRRRPAGHRARDGRARRRTCRGSAVRRTASPPDAVAVDAAGADVGARCSSPATAVVGWARSRCGRRDASVDLTRPRGVPPTPAAGRPSLDGPTRSLDADDLARWTALGLALDLRRPRRHHARRASTWRPRTPRERRQYGAAIGSFQAVQHLLADALVAMEGSRSVALHAAWAVDALARRRRARRRRRRPRPTAPGPPARCARPRSRCTAASATPGSAWPTSTCAGRCSRPTCSAASAPTSTACSPHRGIGGADGLR